MDETMGQRIRRIRKQRGLTQDQLAEAIEANRVTVANYERGLYKPASDALMKIANVLNTTTDNLLGNEDQSERETISDDDIKFALFGDVANITDAQFAEVKKFAQFIIEREKSSK